jgi:hypothetical protein
LLDDKQPFNVFSKGHSVPLSLTLVDSSVFLSKHPSYHFLVSAYLSRFMFSTAIERPAPEDPARSISLLELGAYHHLGGHLPSSSHVPRDSALLLSDHISGHSETIYSDHSGTYSSPASYSSRSPPEHFDTSPSQYHASYPNDQHLPREENHVQYSSSSHNIEARTSLPHSPEDISIPTPSLSHPPSATEAPTLAAPSRTEPKVLSANPRPRKTRREKPHIQLASDQPPTTQGKPRARVYVACIQWCVCSVANRSSLLLFTPL